VLLAGFLGCLGSLHGDLLTALDSAACRLLRRVHDSVGHLAHALVLQTGGRDEQTGHEAERGGVRPCLTPFVLEDVEALRCTQSLALLRLAVLHLSAVGARRLVAVLDQLLEPLEVAVHLTLDDAEKIAGDVLRG